MQGKTKEDNGHGLNRFVWPFFPLMEWRIVFFFFFARAQSLYRQFEMQ